MSIPYETVVLISTCISQLMLLILFRCELRVNELMATLNRQSSEIAQLTADLELATQAPPEPEPNWSQRVVTILSGAPLVAVHAIASQMLPALPPPGIIGL